MRFFLKFLIASILLLDVHFSLAQAGILEDLISKRHPSSNTYVVDRDPNLVSLKLSSDPDLSDVTDEPPNRVATHLFIDASGNGFAAIDSVQNYLCQIRRNQIGDCFTDFYTHTQPFECDSVPGIYTGDEKTLISCVVITQHGTGIYGKGKYYFLMDDKLTLLGFLPSSEYMSGWGTGTQFKWTAQDKFGTLDDADSLNAPKGIQRCVEISVTNLLRDEISGSMNRCSSYIFDLEARTLEVREGKNLLGALLMESFQAETESLIEQ